MRVHHYVFEMRLLLIHRLEIDDDGGGGLCIFILYAMKVWIWNHLYLLFTQRILIHPIRIRTRMICILAIATSFFYFTWKKGK